MSKKICVFSAILLALVLIIVFSFPGFFGGVIYYKREQAVTEAVDIAEPNVEPVATATSTLNTVTYDQKLEEIANNPPDPIVYSTVKTVVKNGAGKSITKITKVPLSPQPIKTHLWPVANIYPNAGAILPFSRIIAYYGNLYSKNMGVLGEYPEREVLQMLQAKVAEWNLADPGTPAIPALHYIAVVAQGHAGADGKYRDRMPDSEIDKVIAMASKINALVFLDVQVGFSNVQTEVPLLEKYLKMPNVDLGIDPEFSMKGKYPPGKVVGTLDATDINFVSNYLANIVRENNLTPKVLVIHRYTEGMVTNYKQIKTVPEVEIVMNMDGWGTPAKKIGTYKNFIYPEPVQFTGFKLFYKNDTLIPGSTMLAPADLLKLNPQPLYIQYQ